MEFIFTLLNIAALLGWCTIIVLLILHEQRQHIHDELWYEQIITILKYLEVICCIEVGRIAIGQLKGNLVLGLVLHMIRVSCIVFILPDGLATNPAKSAAEMNDGYAILEQPSLSLLILFSWCITEVTRYPMYIFPSSKLARDIRLVVPMLTFPIGCAAECYSAYSVLYNNWGVYDDSGYNIHVKANLCLLVVVFVNGVLGPTMAYPALLKKGLQVFGISIGKKKKEKYRPVKKRQ